MGQALGFLGRAAGLVTLLLLTATLVLGTGHATRTSSARWPRFAVAALHRNLSLLALSFVGVHVVSMVLDPNAGLSWLDVVVPFLDSYWLGFGTVALYLMLALIATSLLRHRLGTRSWRLAHLSAYLLWPIAVLHGFGIGGDDSGLLWVRVLYGACVLVVVLAVVRRLRAGETEGHPRRAMAGERR